MGNFSVDYARAEARRSCPTTLFAFFLSSIQINEEKQAMSYERKNEMSSAPKSTRRNAISSIAGAMLLGACACHRSNDEASQPPAAATNGAACSFDGYGAPFDEGLGADPRNLRALLGLWLLFVTNKKFIFDKNDTVGNITAGMEAALASQVGSLTYLTAKDAHGNNVPPSGVLHALVNTTNTVIPSFTVPATASGAGDGRYNVSYGAALLIVQDLFGKLATGNTSPLLQEVYSGPPENCPKSQSTVLSVATNTVNPALQSHPS
jgi:hypothetical protein